MNPDAARLNALLTDLQVPQQHILLLDRYFHGQSPLSYLSAEAKAALRQFDRMSSNLCRTAVVSLGERLRPNGFDGHPDAYRAFLRSNLDQLASVAHQRALLYSECPILVWTDRYGRPRATVEHPNEMAVQRDPVTREVVSAIKRVETKDSTEAWIYLPDEIQHWRADTVGSTAGFTLRDRIANPLGVVPVAVLGLEDDVSVIADLIPLQAALDKLLLDALIASEYSGRPRRIATGVELVETPKLDDNGTVVLDVDGEPVLETVNPFPEANRMMIAENPEAKISQLPAADLGGFEAGVRIIISQAMMVSGLPAHYVGLLQDSVTSADALRAAEAALVARAEAKQLAYGLGWERTAQLLVALSTGVDVEQVNVRVKWAPADTRSQAQEADSAVKLYSSGVISRATTLRRLGFTDDEITAELAAVAAENTRNEKN